MNHAFRNTLYLCGVTPIFSDQEYSIISVFETTHVRANIKKQTAENMFYNCVRHYTLALAEMLPL